MPAPIGTMKIDAGLARAAVVRERSRRDFAYFCQHVWGVVEPGRALKWNWHLDALCEHLAATLQPDGPRRLMVNMPPRHLKSTIVSVLFPCWVWLNHPERRFLTASYAKNLATRDAVRSRRVMQSDLYQALAPPFVLTNDQNEKQRYENDKTGYRMITAPGAGTTGEGGDIQIIDDPHNVLDVESDDMRQEVLHWHDTAWSNRANDAATAISIITAQRTHDSDLCGHILEKSADRWNVLKLPTLYESEHTERPNALGFVDPRTIEGELLCPAHFDANAVEDARETMGPWAFDAQHQQRPSGIKGTILSIDDFARYDSLPLRFDMEIMSWDFAFRGKNESKEKARIADPSFVVGQRWGFIKQEAYLLDQVRGQWDFARSLTAFRDFCESHDHVRKKLIEKKANGEAIKSSVQEDIFGIEMVDPVGSKIERALAIQPMSQSGRIHIPVQAHWLDRFLAEVKAFPFTKHDDQVDCMTQALNYFLMKSGKARKRILRLVAA